MNDRPLDSLAMDYVAGRLDAADMVRFEAMLLESDEAREAVIRTVALREALAEAAAPAAPRGLRPWRVAATVAAAVLVSVLILRPWRAPASSPAGGEDAAAVVGGYLDLGRTDLFLDPVIHGDEDAPEEEVLPDWIDDVVSN